MMVILLGVAFLSAASLPAQERKGPVIEVKEDKHDFGKIVQGTQVTHVFEIRNAGTEPLLIDKVQSS